MRHCEGEGGNRFSPIVASVLLVADWHSCGSKIAFICWYGNSRLRQLTVYSIRKRKRGKWGADHGQGIKNGLACAAVMARSASRCTQEGDSRVSVPSERAEARDFAEPRELSLEEVLKSYEQPINEEQAWAVCYQCCSWLRVPRLDRSEDRTIYQVKDPSSIFLHRDGTVSLHPEIWNSNGNNTNFLIALITRPLKACPHH